MIVDDWYDDMRWLWLVVGWNSMFDKFWGSSGLAVMLPDFCQTYGLSHTICMSTYVMSLISMHIKM